MEDASPIVLSSPPSEQQDADVSNEVAHFAALLGERDAQPLETLRRLLVARGRSFLERVLTQTDARMAEGGMLRADGTPRTRGGVFFALVRESMPFREWRMISPPKPKPDAGDGA